MHWFSGKRWVSSCNWVSLLFLPSVSGDPCHGASRCVVEHADVTMSMSRGSGSAGGLVFCHLGFG